VCYICIGCIENDIFNASVVWPSIAFIWEGIGEFIDTFRLDKFQMVMYGYIGTLLIQTLIREIVEIFLEMSKCMDDGEPCNELIRVFAEDLYLAILTSFCILAWKGKPLTLYLSCSLRHDGNVESHSGLGKLFSYQPQCDAHKTHPKKSAISDPDL